MLFDAVQAKLLFAKVLFFSTALSNVSWTRFQNNVLLEKGISTRDVGVLKGIGLLFKLFGELVCCVVADKHDPIKVFLICTLVQVYTLECVRSSDTLSFEYVIYIKFLRGITACLPTLTNALCCSLTVGTKEGKIIYFVIIMNVLAISDYVCIIINRIWPTKSIWIFSMGSGGIISWCVNRYIWNKCYVLFLLWILFIFRFINVLWQ